MQTIPAIDLYRELEVDPAASTETIDAAWKSLLKRHHPDVAADPTAAHERVKRLNLAHEWLSDPRRRAMYDRSRRQPGVIVVPRPPRSSRRRGESDAHVRHNPYTEDGGPGRVSTPIPGAAAMPHLERRAVSRIPALILPVALVSVLIVVAISSYLASVRTAPIADTSALGPTGASAAASRGTATSATSQAGSLPSGAADPRSLAPPDLASALPAACKGANVSRAFSFEVLVAGAPGKAFVVRCDDTHSYGPLVYVTSSDGWRLRGSAGMHQGYAYQGFSGAIAGRSPDEFGVAWTRGDGTRSTVTLYRIAKGVQAFWDSSSIGLAWSLARFTYQAKPDATAPGSLIVVSADLKTGTPNCATCKDHQLYREFYVWDTARPVPVLHQTAREPYGLGPP